MKTVRLSDVPRAPARMEGAKSVWKQLPIGRADGAPTFSFRVFTVEPEGHTPFHTHEFEHLNYVIQGKGCLVDEQGTQRPLESGDFALVLPGEKHQYRNRSADEAFVMLCAVPLESE